MHLARRREDALTDDANTLARSRRARRELARACRRPDHRTLADCRRYPSNEGLTRPGPRAPSTAADGARGGVTAGHQLTAR